MYVRKVKKSGKTYLYYYKSKRVGNKVKSIYVGKALEEAKIKKPKIKISSEKRLDKKEIVTSLINFDNLLNEITRLIDINDLGGAINIYNNMLKTYSELDLSYNDKAKLLEKLNLTYDNLVELSKELNIKID